MAETLYTVLDSNGEIMERSVDAGEAARAVMVDDGYTYSIQPITDGAGKGGFALWTSTFSRNSTTGARETESVLFSLETDPAAAELDIYRQVIEHSDWWRGCNIMTDVEYDAIAADFAAQLAEDDRA